MLPVILCPQHDPGLPYSVEDSSAQSQVNHPTAAVNETSQKSLNERENEIRLLKTASDGQCTALLVNFLRKIGMDVRSLDILRGTPVTSTSLRWPLPPSIVPLDDCILMIIWEILSNPRSHIIHDGWTVDEFFNFLVAAALCQVDTGVGFLLLRPTFDLSLTRVIKS
jgi:hypothetical protein